MVFREINDRQRDRKQETEQAREKVIERGRDGEISENSEDTTKLMKKYVTNIQKITNKMPFLLQVH